MFKQISFIALIFGCATQALGAPLEKDAIYTGDWSREYAQVIADELSGLVRVRGYRCNTVSNLQRWVFSPGFDLSCNNFAYKYEIAYRDERWVITRKH